MAQEKIKVVRLQASKVKADLESKGYVPRQGTLDIAKSDLPATGTFTGYRPEPNPFGGQDILRIKAVGDDGKEYECALSRIVYSGIKKVTKDQTISESDIVLRPTKKGLKYMLNGRPLNPSIPNAEHEAIAFLVGKKFKSELATSFAISYMREGNFDSKKQALETEHVQNYFELEIGEDIAE